MACDPDALLDQAKCHLCLIPPGMMETVEVVLLCAIRDGNIIGCEPQELIDQSFCLWCKLGPIPGAIGALKVSILCDLVNTLEPGTVECTASALMYLARCDWCVIPPGLLDIVELLILCAVLDGDADSCDPLSLVTRASCLWCKLGQIPGAIQAIKIVILCDILNTKVPAVVSTVCAADDLIAESRCMLSCLPAGNNLMAKVLVLSLWCQISHIGFPGESFWILTEAGEPVLTEAGDNMRVE